MSTSKPLRRGFFYVATGKSFYREAVNSAKSLKRHHPDIPIAIYTDQEVTAEELFSFRLGEPPFEYGFGEKIMALQKTPFDRTVFIDTDTFIANPIDDLFVLLDRVDIAVSHDPSREWMHRKEVDIPECFSEPNTGVIAFNSTASVMDLLSNWETLYSLQENQHRYPHDQPTFRRALYFSKVTFSILPPEYNARLIYPIMVARKVKIIHARCDNLNRLHKVLNQESKPRVFTWSISDLLKLIVNFVRLRFGRGW